MTNLNSGIEPEQLPLAGHLMAARQEALPPVSAEPPSNEGAGGASKALHTGAKRRAILSLLANPATAILSDAEIARRLGVAGRYVGTLRLSAPDLRPKLMPDDGYRLVNRGGVRKSYLMHVANIGPRPVQHG